MTAAIIGILLGVAVGLVGRTVGFDRDRAFYTTIAIVVASYYPLFAVMGASGSVLTIEVLSALGFCTLAVIGFKRNMWLVAAAIVGHGVFDLLGHPFIANPGMPVWWPAFCAAIDVIMGAWLALTLVNAHAVSQKHCCKTLTTAP